MFLTTLALLAIVAISQAQDVSEGRPDGAGRPDGVGGGRPDDKPVKPPAGERAPSAESEPSEEREASAESEGEGRPEGAGRPESAGKADKAGKGRPSDNADLSDKTVNSACIFTPTPVPPAPAPTPIIEVDQSDVARKRSVLETREFALKAGKTADAGTVTIDRDGDTFTVTIDTTDSEWSVKHAHVFAGAGWPSEWATKAPPPGKFPVSQSFAAADFTTFTTTFTIGDGVLESVCAPGADGGEVAIAVHTESVLLKADGSSGQEETGWAEGEKEFGGSRWGWYTTFCVPCDGSVPEDAPIAAIEAVAAVPESNAELVEEKQAKVKEAKGKGKGKPDSKGRTAVLARINENFKGNEKALEAIKTAIERALAEDDKVKGKVKVEQTEDGVVVTFDDDESQDAGLSILANLAIVNDLEPVDVPADAQLDASSSASIVSLGAAALVAAVAAH